MERPPTSTAASDPAARKPCAATPSASGHDAMRSSPFSRTIGHSIRPCCMYEKAKRPLSQFHSSLTCGSSQANRRVMMDRR